MSERITTGDPMKEPTTNDVPQYLQSAAQTAGALMRLAIEQIDAQLGEGYAKANPVLISGFIQAAASEIAAVTVANGQHPEDAAFFQSRCKAFGAALTEDLESNGS